MADDNMMTDDEMNRRDRQQTPLGINYPASSVQENMKRLMAEGKIDAADMEGWNDPTSGLIQDPN